MKNFYDANNIENAIISLNINDIKIEQTLELTNARLRDLFPECFQLIVKRHSYADRAFAHNIEAHQFDRLDRIFADYLRSKYPDDEKTVEKLVERATAYFHQQQV